MQPPPLPRSDEKRSSLEHVRMGQRLVILGILLNLVGILLTLIPRGPELRTVLSAAAIICGLSSYLFSMMGIFRMTAGLHYRMPRTAIRILLSVLILVQVVNLIVLAVLSSKATRILRTAGYKVGFLGARRRRKKRRSGQLSMQAPVGNFRSAAEPD